jgi:hypothetical protein
MLANAIFHGASREVVETFLADCSQLETGFSHNEVAELLLQKGANPNIYST